MRRRRMISRVITAAVKGMSGVRILVETDIARGLPAMTVVGLGDAAVKESRERIRSAVTGSGYTFPGMRITVNLSPACIRKRGSHFDLAIAMGILSASGQVFDRKLAETAFIGELSLGGDVRGCSGILPMIAELRKSGIKGVVIPEENVWEAALFDDIDVYPVKSLSEAADVANLIREAEAREPVSHEYLCGNFDGENADFGDVKGQEQAKRAITVAVAGGHGLLMTGSPATGKTMLASRIPGIMMPMDREELMETAAIYSAAGLLGKNRPFASGRPFRCPGTAISKAGLIGGGYPPVPGEITLAHRGVLFLDEVGEYGRDVIEALRIPLEKKEISLIRRGEKYVFPADCLLVAATNPCKCGYYGDGTDRCTCTEDEVRRYRGRLSGPVLDRIDMHIYLNPVNYGDLGDKNAVTSDMMREKVEQAWIAQKRRYYGTGIRLNGSLDEAGACEFCSAGEDGEELLKNAYERLKLNPRTLFKVRKIARTIADIDGAENVEAYHVAEALQYRERE